MAEPVEPSMLLPPNDIDSGWTWGELEAYANELYAEVLAGRARLARLEEANVELLRDTAKHELRLAAAEQVLRYIFATGAVEDNGVMARVPEGLRTLVRNYFAQSSGDLSPFAPAAIPEVIDG